MRYVRLMLAGLLWVLIPGTVAATNFWDITLDVSMTNNDFQSPSLCEASCFAATYSFTTVPFYTLNTPRSVSLVYNGDRTFPRPYIFADVTPSAGTPTISKFKLQATVNGTAVTFLNGETTLNFAGTNNAVRLAGQFNASSYATGIYPMVITITAMHSNGTNTVRTQSTQLMVENESTSPIAKGWMLGGIQHLYLPGGGYMVTEGDGTAVRFPSLGSVATDFTKLTLESGVYVRRYPDSTAVYFSTAGLMTEIRDRLGRSTTFQYDGSNRLTTINDPMKNIGRTVPYISIAYGANGISSITTTGHGPNKVTTVTVDASRNLQSIADPDSKSTGFTYDASGRLYTATDRQGGVQQFNYDSFSWKVTSILLPSIPVDAGGGSTTNAQPSIGLTPWMDKGVPRSSTATLPKAAFAPTDISANVSDPDGRITSFAPDRYGQPVWTTDNLANLTTIVRSGIFPTSVTHPDGSIDTYTYSGALLSSMKLAGDSAVRFTYGPAGQVATVTGASVNDETRALNLDGSIYYVEYSDFSQDVFSYDATTKAVASYRDPKFRITTYTYDPIFGNTASVTAPGNRTSTTTYDTYGRDSISSATSQPSTTITYDAMNRPIAVSDGVNASPTTISYNETTREKTVQDPQGTAHKEEVNALGWLTKRYDASGNGSYVSYRYSPGGLMKSATNRRGQRMDYTYDNIGRLASKSGANTSTDNFSYSNDGRITVGWNSVSRDSIFIDPSSAVDSVVTRIGGQRFRVRHSGGTYFNRPDSVTISSTTSVQFPSRVYGHNTGTGALSWIDVGSFGRTNFTFSTDLERTNTSWSTGVSRTEAYTSLRLPYDANFSGGNVGDSFRRSYRYDVLGRIDTEQRPNGTNTRQRAFSYDGLGRLSQVEYRNQPCNVWPTAATVDTASGWRYSCASPDSTLTYTYDAAGNRTDHSAVTIAGNRYQSFNNASFAYDADGNQIQKYDPSRFNRQFYWSAENRLDSLMQDGWYRIRYEYNAFGQPVKKWRGDVNGINVDRYYLWDGDQWLAELDGSMNRIADYVYLPGIDEPFAAVVGQTTATAIRYHAQDELGNVEGHFEGTSVNQNNDYDPWGTPTIGISADSRLLWKGLMWEGDVVSLYHMRNRWYDPESGRFLSEDPLGVDAGLNQYAFVGDDPVNGFDASGLSGDCWVEYTYHSRGGETVPGTYRVIGGTCQAANIPSIIEGGGVAVASLMGPRVGHPSGGGGGTSPVRRVAAAACRVLKNWASPAGAYRGVGASYFLLYGVTGGAGVYSDASGPGVYVRVGVGGGVEGSAGWETGVVFGEMSGLGLEFEGVGLSRSASGAVGLSGISAFSAKSGGLGSRPFNAMPVSAHAAVTSTFTFGLSRLCTN
jgi:RHS repeat-associated protein